MDLQNESKLTQEKWAGMQKIFEMDKVPADDDQKLMRFHSLYPEIRALKYIEELYTPYHKKWGFVVYRTTYSDNEKWSKFIDMFQDGVRKFVKATDEHGDLEHLKYLDFPVRENEKLFNNASKADLRKHFNEWVNSDDATEEQGLKREDMPDYVKNYAGLRLRYFIQVDQEAMESVLENGTVDGYVNFVWASSEWPGPDPEDEEDIKADDGCEEIEGMTCTHIGFQRIAVGHIYPEYWREMTISGEDWVRLYTRPPRVRGADPCGW